MENEIKFKEGQKVFDPSKGWGVVKEITPSSLHYPIKVIFDDSLLDLYEKDGKFSTSSKYPSLFVSIDEAISYLKEVKTKEKVLSFREFLEEHEINWDDFLENCKPKNQRWINVYSYYDCPKKKFKESPMMFIKNSFSWIYSEFWTPAVLVALNEEWQNLVKNYNEKITFK